MHEFTDPNNVTRHAFAPITRRLVATAIAATLGAMAFGAAGLSFASVGGWTSTVQVEVDGQTAVTWPVPPSPSRTPGHAILSGAAATGGAPVAGGDREPTATPAGSMPAVATRSARVPLPESAGQPSRSSSAPADPTSGTGTTGAPSSEPSSAQSPAPPPAAASAPSPGDSP